METAHGMLYFSYSLRFKLINFNKYLSAKFLIISSNRDNRSINTMTCKNRSRQDCVRILSLRRRLLSYRVQIATGRNNASKRFTVFTVI